MTNYETTTINIYPFIGSTGVGNGGLYKNIMSHNTGMGMEEPPFNNFDIMVNIDKITDNFVCPTSMKVFNYTFDFTQELFPNKQRVKKRRINDSVGFLYQFEFIQNGNPTFGTSKRYVFRMYNNFQQCDAANRLVGISPEDYEVDAGQAI